MAGDREKGGCCSHRMSMLINLILLDGYFQFLLNELFEGNCYSLHYHVHLAIRVVHCSQLLKFGLAGLPLIMYSCPKVSLLQLGLILLPIKI